MPNRRLLIVACLALASSGCVKGEANPPPCAAPVELPDRALNDQEIEVMWGRDRSALRECGDRLEAATGRSVSNAL